MKCQTHVVRDDPSHVICDHGGEWKLFPGAKEWTEITPCGKSDDVTAHAVGRDINADESGERGLTLIARSQKKF